MLKHLWNGRAATSTDRGLACAGALAVLLTICGAGRALGQSGGVVCNGRAFSRMYDSPGNVLDVVVVGQTAFLADAEEGLKILDISDPANPVLLGALDTPHRATQLQVEGGTAYIADDDGGLQIIDISDPTQPTALGAFAAQNMRFVEVAGTTAYLAATSLGFLVVDVSDPAAPALLTTVDTPGFVEHIEVVGTTAYVVDATRPLRVYDVSDPASPQLLTTWNMPSDDDYSIRIADGIGYIGYWTGEDVGSGFQVVDFSNPAMPTLLGVYTDDWTLRFETDVSNGVAYVSRDGGIELMDVSDPAAPHPIAMFGAPSTANSIQLSGSTVYAAYGQLGLWRLDTNHAQTDPLLGASEGDYDTDVVVSGDFAYVASGPDGVRSVDVSDPHSPVEVSRRPAGDASALAIEGSLIFVANGSQGLRILESTAGMLSVRGDLDTPGEARAVAVSGATAFVADDHSGLRIINASNPDAPVTVGTYGTIGGALDVAVSGSIAYVVGVAGTDLDIVDVTNPAAPDLITRYTPPGATGYFPSIALSPDGTIAYIANSDAGLLVIDVSNPAAPSQLSVTWTYGQAGDLALAGDQLLVSCHGRVHVFDVSKPLDPVWIGAHDVDGQTYGLATQDGIGYFTDTDFEGVSVGLRIVALGDCACPADLNGDGDLNTLDILAFLNAWTANEPPADWNGDGTIDTRDVLAYLNAWNAGC